MQAGRESLSFDDLTGCLEAAAERTPSPDELIEALKAFDHAGSGTLRTADVRTILMEITDEKMTKNQVDELIRDGDKYRTGVISLDFFTRMLSSF
jgi:Ca2+-binding EF-hand superfamily protein